MGITHLSGLEVAGVPTMGIGGLPPWTGNWFFVSEATGSDGNTGAADQPFATLAHAQLAATANQDDVVVFEGTIHTAATIAWAKNRVHLIGTGAPCENTRSRISQTGASVFTPLVNVTAQGCVFMNFATFHGFANASAQVCWAEAGGRNSYIGVSFLGMGDATAAAQAGGRSLTVAASGENFFESCFIGLDTITRSTSNASLEFLAGSPRNRFRNCVFQMLTSSASALHITCGAGGIDRYALFDNCDFLNSVDSGGTTINAAIIANAAAGGSIVLNGGISIGATAIATTGPVYGNGAVPTATTSSIGIKLT